MNKETGGAAFPTTLDQVNGFRDGMTLRDYFAAKALTGMLADSELKATPDEFATRSYALADAMLEARK